MLPRELASHCGLLSYKSGNACWVLRKLWRNMAFLHSTLTL